MARRQETKDVLAAFPISDSEIVLICSHAIDSTMEKTRHYRFESGLSVKSVRLDRERPKRIVLRTEKRTALPLTTDQITIRNFRSGLSTRSRDVISPKFIQNVHEAMELKVPYFGKTFPYASDLVGLHVSVACCTGCNGGIHDRNLVVLNHHIGGAWSGIWVQTGKTIEAPYPRWQKVLCAGGVVAELNGSMTVMDKGWMEIHKQDEIPHHAPPPLPIETADLPFQ
jgi:hypothetical protein